MYASGFGTIKPSAHTMNANFPQQYYCIMYLNIECYLENNKLIPAEIKIALTTIITITIQNGWQHLITIAMINGSNVYTEKKNTTRNQTVSKQRQMPIQTFNQRLETVVYNLINMANNNK